MKLFLSVLLIVCCQVSFGQRSSQYLREKGKLWATGEIFYSDGRKQTAELCLLVSFNEGSLQVKNQDQIATYSPRAVTQFIYYDSLFEKYRQFVSVKTQFLDRSGSKNAFLELIYEGGDYSLFRRHIPVAKLHLAIVPLPNFHVGWAVWSEGKIEPGLFLHIKGDRAYQISKGIENAFEVKDEKRLNYKLDEGTLKRLLGVNFKEMRRSLKKTRLDLSHERGFIEGLKYLNGASFQYSRKDTPKKMRN